MATSIIPPARRREQWRIGGYFLVVWVADRGGCNRMRADTSSLKTLPAPLYSSLEEEQEDRPQFLPEVSDSGK
jgi:hypothetical protein